MLCRVIGWRTLLLRREQIVAMEEKRPVRRLFPFDYLIGIDDFSRMGAFRFKELKDNVLCLTQSNDFLCDEVKAAVQGIRLAISLELNQSTRSTMLLQQLQCMEYIRMWAV